MNIAVTHTGRYGDTILASIVVNMLTAAGHKVLWATPAGLMNLVAAVAPDAQSVVHPAFKDWGYNDKVNSEGLKEVFPGYDAYVNVQFGASEDYAHLSGKHPLRWLRDKVERLTGVSLGTNWKDFLVYRNDREVAIPDRTDKPLAIIAPDGISDYPPLFWCGTLLREVHDRLSETYDVRLLVEHPRGTPDGYKYLHGYTFVDAIKLIQKADHFVGQDSGLSWAALYSSCTKEVYHRRGRYETYKTSFTEVDPTVIEHFV